MDNRGAVAVIVAAGDASLKLGTGFFVHSPGLLVTNFHVVENTALVGVRLRRKGDLLWARTVRGFDVNNDLAILEVEDAKVRPIIQGDSDRVRVGEPIVVVSNPEGLEQTVSDGLISGIREVGGRKLFQISAPISEGSSGGPVFNQRGEVIAIVVAFLESGQNLNFAIPINYAKPLLEAQAATPIAALPTRKYDGPRLKQNQGDEYSKGTADDEAGYVDCGSFDFVTVFDSPDPAKLSTLERLRCWDSITILGETTGQFTALRTSSGLVGYLRSGREQGGISRFSGPWPWLVQFSPSPRPWMPWWRSSASLLRSSP